MKKCIVLMICIIGQYVLGNSLIPVNYSRMFHEETFPMIIGFNLKDFSTKLDTTAQYNMIKVNPKEPFEKLNATRLNTTIDVDFYGNMTTGEDIITSIHFKDDIQKRTCNLRFFLFPSLSSSNSGILALPFKFKDISYSIIHHYKIKGLIDKLAFSMVREFKEEHNGNFYFGGIPTEATVNRTHSYCNVLGLSEYWDCQINQVQLLNKTHQMIFELTDNINIGIFDTSTDFLFAPAKFIDFLIDYYTSLNIEVMIYLKNSYKKRQLYASYTKLFAGKLKVTLGDYVYEIDMASLWMCYETYCYLEIIENPHGEFFGFGTQFFNKHHMLFDYETKRVNFYSNEGVKHKEILLINESIKTVMNTKLIVVANLVLCVIGFGLVYWVKVKII